MLALYSFNTIMIFKKNNSFNNKMFTRNINTITRSTRSGSISSSGSNVNTDRLNIPSNSSSNSLIRQGTRENSALGNEIPNVPSNPQSDALSPMNSFLNQCLDKLQILKFKAYGFIDEAHTFRDVIVDYAAGGCVRMIRFSLGALPNNTSVSAGVEPLDSVLALNLIPYTGTLRYDCLIHNNYTIFMEGYDTDNYRFAYEYLKDYLDNLGSLTECYHKMLQLENEIIQNDLNFIPSSEEIANAIDNLITLLNTLN